MARLIRVLVVVQAPVEPLLPTWVVLLDAGSLHHDHRDSRSTSLGK
jgi:hypothetical protein